MKYFSKVITFILFLVLIFIVLFALDVNSDLFQGRLSGVFNPVTQPEEIPEPTPPTAQPEIDLLSGSASSETPSICDDEWSEAFTATYTYDPETNADRTPLSGITRDDIDRLGRAIEDGCDVKVQFQGGADDLTSVCSGLELSNEIGLDSFSVECRLASSFHEGNFRTQNHLYDLVNFWINADAVPQISKNRLVIDDQLTDDSYEETSVSFFSPTNWDANETKEVTVYTRK